MSTEVATAVKNLKTIGTEITQWENRAEVVRAEHDRLLQARDALQAEIQQKTSDFAIYMAQRDSEAKAQRTELNAEREKLAKDKEEFQAILKQHKTERDSLNSDKQQFEIQKLKHEASTKNVQDFILAVRRASGLLGI
jgi:chromosome segregation ATPase